MDLNFDEIEIINKNFITLLECSMGISHDDQQNIDIPYSCKYPIVFDENNNYLKSDEITNFDEFYLYEDKQKYSLYEQFPSYKQKEKNKDNIDFEYQNIKFKVSKYSDPFYYREIKINDISDSFKKKHYECDGKLLDDDIRLNFSFFIEKKFETQIFYHLVLKFKYTLVDANKNEITTKYFNDLSNLCINHNGIKNFIDEKTRRLSKFFELKIEKSFKYIKNEEDFLKEIEFFYYIQKFIIENNKVFYSLTPQDKESRSINKVLSLMDNFHKLYLNFYNLKIDNVYDNKQFIKIGNFIFANNFINGIEFKYFPYINNNSSRSLYIFSIFILKKENDFFNDYDDDNDNINEFISKKYNINKYDENFVVFKNYNLNYHKIDIKYDGLNPNSLFEDKNFIEKINLLFLDNYFNIKKLNNKNNIHYINDFFVDLMYFFMFFDEKKEILYENIPISSNYINDYVNNNDDDNDINNDDIKLKYIGLNDPMCYGDFFLSNKELRIFDSFFCDNGKTYYCEGNFYEVIKFSIDFSLLELYSIYDNIEKQYYFKISFDVLYETIYKNNDGNDKRSSVMLSDIHNYFEDKFKNYKDVNISDILEYNNISFFTLKFELIFSSIQHLFYLKNLFILDNYFNIKKYDVMFNSENNDKNNDKNFTIASEKLFDILKIKNESITYEKNEQYGEYKFSFRKSLSYQVLFERLSDTKDDCGDLFKITIEVFNCNLPQEDKLIKDFYVGELYKFFKKSFDNSLFLIDNGIKVSYSEIKDVDNQNEHLFIFEYRALNPLSMFVNNIYFTRILKHLQIFLQHKDEYNIVINSEDDYDMSDDDDNNNNNNNNNNNLANSNLEKWGFINDNKTSYFDNHSNTKIFDIIKIITGSDDSYNNKNYVKIDNYYEYFDNHNEIRIYGDPNNKCFCECKILKNNVKIILDYDIKNEIIDIFYLSKDKYFINNLNLNCIEFRNRNELNFNHGRNGYFWYLKISPKNYNNIDEIIRNLVFVNFFIKNYIDKNYNKMDLNKKNIINNKNYIYEIYNKLLKLVFIDSYSFENGNCIFICNKKKFNIELILGNENFLELKIVPIYTNYFKFLENLQNIIKYFDLPDYDYNINKIDVRYDNSIYVIEKGVKISVFFSKREIELKYSALNILDFQYENPKTCIFLKKYDYIMGFKNIAYKNKKRSSVGHLKKKGDKRQKDGILNKFGDVSLTQEKTYYKTHRVCKNLIIHKKV